MLCASNDPCKIYQIIIKEEEGITSFVSDLNSESIFEYLYLYLYLGIFSRISIIR